MSFFDKAKGVVNDAVAAVSDAANDVTKSAKEMNEKSKLNRAIKNEEAKISNLYAVMGKKLYESNTVAPAGFEDQFNGINAAKNEIAKLQEELSAIDASSKCPKCGNKVSPNQKFCQGCGCNLEEFQKSQPVVVDAVPVEPQQTTGVNTDNQQ